MKFKHNGQIHIHPEANCDVYLYHLLQFQMEAEHALFSLWNNVKAVEFTIPCNEFLFKCLNIWKEIIKSSLCMFLLAIVRCNM